MVVGIENIMQWLEVNDTEHWKIKNSSANSVIFSSPKHPDDNLQMEESLRQFKIRLDLLEPGVYEIHAWTKGQSNNDHRKTKFSKKTEGSTFNTVQGYGNYTRDDIDREMEKMREEFNRQQEIARLKEENSILQQQNAGIGRIAQRMEPYFEPLMIAVFKTFFPSQKIPAPAVAGVESQTQTNTTMNENTRAENALIEWSNMDSDYLTLLEGIVNLAKTNPAMYKQAKTILMSNNG